MLRGVWLIVFTLLSWASVPLFLRDFAALGIDGFTSNGWRYLISAVFWLPFLFVLRKKGEVPNALIKASWAPVLFNIAGQTCFAWGPALLEPGFFSFVFRVQIVFVTLGAYLLFPSERGLLRSPAYWLGIGLVVLGSVGLFVFRPPWVEEVAGTKAAAVMTGAAGEWIAGLSADARFWLGVGVSLLSGILFAGYGLSVRKCVNQYAPVASFGVICQFTAVGMVIAALVLGRDHGVHMVHAPMSVWVKIVASAFIGIAISHVAYYASLKRLGVAMTVGVIQLQPVVTAVASSLIFGERLTPMQWACGVVGVTGAMIMLWAGQKKASEAKLAEGEVEGN